MSELEIAAILRNAIQESGKSLNQVANESGVSQPQLSRFVRGERSLSLDSVELLFRYFGLKVEGAAPKKGGKKK
jgi:transcriptional regulator with XRE-family HTH domain